MPTPQDIAKAKESFETHLRTLIAQECTSYPDLGIEQVHVLVTYNPPKPVKINIGASAASK
jgi:hypothetical protein